MNIKFPAGTLTNELLLSIMPFNSGYLLEEDAETPLEDSVTFAPGGDRISCESTLFFLLFP